MNARRRRLRQAALLIFAFTAAWTLIVMGTGGFVFHIGTMRVSARRALNPGIAALAAAAVALALATAAERRRAIANASGHIIVGSRGVVRVVRERRQQLASMIVLAAVVSVVTFGLFKGTFVAGAADAYGYVSQADLWAKGILVVRQPFARDMRWPNAAETLAPLGYRPYRPAPHGTDIVPIYSPGVPMLMAVFKLVAGAKAVYLVVPVLGGLAVWITFVMGNARYPRWLFETETPLVFLALVAPIVLPPPAEFGRDRRPRPTAIAWFAEQRYIKVGTYVRRWPCS